MNRSFDPSLKLKRYLGDGVYVGFDGDQIWVWTERDGREHAIAFERETMASLVHYTVDLKRMAHDEASNEASFNQEQI